VIPSDGWQPGTPAIELDADRVTITARHRWPPLVDSAFVDMTDSQDPSIGGAAGALESTDHDLLLFAAALADGKLLSPRSTAEMFTFVPGDDYSQFGIDHGYGLGIEKYENDTLAMIGHMGTGNAQSAFLGFDAERGTAVVVMTNTAVAGPQAIMAFEALTGRRDDRLPPRSRQSMGPLLAADHRARLRSVLNLVRR